MPMIAVEEVITMKRKVALILAIVFCFISATSVASAAGGSPVARLMPANYSYTEDLYITQRTNTFPPGYGHFTVTIEGIYDLQGDNVITIDSESFNYLGGVNCVDYDLTVETWIRADSRGVVFWKLSGTVTFGWTSPITGMQYETVTLGSDEYSFKALDYLV